MAFDLFDVLILSVFLLILVYWWRAQGVKHSAIRAVKSHCKSMDVQLLDDSVELKRFWFKRNTRGQLAIWRSYAFEFSSTGEERYQGRVIMLGMQLEQVDLAPHRLPG